MLIYFISIYVKICGACAEPPVVSLITMRKRSCQLTLLISMIAMQIMAVRQRGLQNK